MKIETPHPGRLLVALVVLSALVGCGRDAETDASATAGGRPPVILVSIDTLRSDRLPAYGYDRVQTPHLDRLREDGILFENAFSHVPLTLPAHASMLTGLLPTEHGVRENLGYSLDGAAYPSLPRRLREEGYATAAAVSALVLREETGLAEGFELYDDDLAIGSSSTPTSSPQRGGEETLQAIDPWIEKVRDLPFFLFFHIYEPHRPFDAPEPFASRYFDPYDAEIAQADAIVGQLLERLESLGIYDQALIILTSDHGEGLGDHGDPEHGPFVYREVMQVPLIVKLPGAAERGTTIAAAAQLVDLYPTVLDVLGLTPRTALAGISLLDLEEVEPRPLYGETYFPRLHFGWSELTSLIEFPYHLIWGPDPELYDLAADPGELNDLGESERETVDRLLASLREFATDFQPPGEVDDETRKSLASLGYIGAVPNGGGSLADPKSRVHVLAALLDAFRFYQQRDFEQAAASYRSVLDEEPAVFDAWEYLGHSLMQLQRPHEALAAFEKALTLTGGLPSMSGAAAGALAALGRYDEARSLAEAAAESSPGVDDLLVRIAIEQGDLSAAERFLDRALERSTRSPGLLVAQAELHIAAGRYEQAIAATEQAERAIEVGMNPESYRGLFTARGRAHAFLGDGRLAEQGFLEEINRDPASLPAYSELALVYAVVGDRARVSETLRRMMEHNPGPAAYHRAAETLRALGDPRLADEVLAAARKRWPDDPRLR